MESEQNPETTVAQHDVLYRGKVVDLFVDTVRLPSGRNVIREVVHHPGGVVALPVLDDGRLLLIRQFRYPLQKYILEFPAGKLDSGQSPLDTMRRELEEETGYQCGGPALRVLLSHLPGILRRNHPPLLRVRSDARCTASRRGRAHHRRTVHAGRVPAHDPDRRDCRRQDYFGPAMVPEPGLEPQIPELRPLGEIVLIRRPRRTSRDPLGLS